MHKEIERAKIRIKKAMEKNRSDFKEAKGNYADTGYDRYWNKMEKLDAEYEELNVFLHAGEEPKATPKEILRLVELQKQVKSIKGKWEYLYQELNLPDIRDVVGINDIFKDIKHLLN